MNEAEPMPDGELWRQIVVGDVGPEDPRVRERAANDPAFAQRLQDLRATEQLLAAAARAEAGWQARVAATPAPAVRADLVGGALRQLAADAPPVRRVSAYARRPWLVAAAALVCVAAGVATWAYVSAGPTPSLQEDDDRPLGGGLDLRVVPLDGGAELTWRGGEPLARYRVVVFDPAAAAGAPPVLPPHETTGTRWRIDPKTFQALPAGVRWRVEVVVRGEVRRRDEAPLR